MLMGRDASGYLISALKYRDLLIPFTWQGLFFTFVDSPYRTSGLYVAAQPFLLLLPGDPKDAAQLLNILFHAATVLITWMLARTLASRWTSLLAATLIAFFPLMTAMARLFYTEAFLVTMVALNLLALYRCRGFSVRGWSLLWGASAGVGLLVKWTFPIYIALPLLVEMWRARHVLLPRSVWNPRALLAGAFAGLLFVAIWWLPNRTLASTLPAGFWIAPGWFLIATATIYTLWIARTDKRWFIAAALLALWVTSLWYLPHPNILQTVFAEDVERGSAPLGLLDWQSFADYLDYLYQQQFGALLFWVAIPAAMLPWLWTLLRTRRSLCPPANLLWWSLFSALLVLLQISQRNSRNLLPLLPQMAILIALGIHVWPRLPRTLITVATLLVLLLQWGAITFDAAQPLYAQRALWVIDAYSMPPASGKTGSDYDIAPALLARVTRDTPAGSAESLGMLVNADYLHRGAVRLLAKSAGMPVEVGDATEKTAIWRDVIENQWIAIKDGDNRDIDPEALSLIERIQQGDPFFSALYTAVEKYPLPNAETVTLYWREGPGLLYTDPARDTSTSKLADTLRTQATDDTTCIYADAAVAVWLGRFDLPCHPIVLANGWNHDAEERLGGLKGTVFDIGNDDDSELRGWLDAHGYKAGEIGLDYDYVAIYGMIDMPLMEVSVDVMWDVVAITLAEVRTHLHTNAGAVIPLETSFAGVDGTTATKWSVRLEDETGTVFAASDRPVLAQDRFGLLVPAHVTAGEYRVVARLYDEATLAPISSTTGVVDVPLFTVTIR